VGPTPSWAKTCTTAWACRVCESKTLFCP